jgi:hypothetical protein
MYRAFLTFYKTTTIPIIGWSFIRAGFRPNPDTFLDPLTVIPSQTLNQIGTYEMTLKITSFLRVLKFQSKQNGLDAGEPQFQDPRNSQ